MGKSLSFVAFALLGLAGAASAADQPVTVARPVEGKIVDSMSHDGASVAAEAHQSFVPRGPGNGCGLSASVCQERAGAGVLTITDPRASNMSFANGFAVADNFQPSITSNITSICFWGYYGPTSVNGTPPVAGAEGFRIRLYTNSLGVPATQVAEWFAGTNFITGDTATPGVTLTRNAALGVPTGAAVPAGTTMFTWTATVPATAVTGGTCYWLEISAASVANVDQRFRWVDATSTSPNDGVTLQVAAAGAYTFASIVNSFDRAFCIGFSNAATLVSPNCQVPPAAANNSCSTAATLTVNAPSIIAATYRSALTTTPYCGANPVATPTLWYKVTGDGTTYTINDCGAGTDAAFDSAINVYCASGACGTNNTGLFCVANNDDSDACGAGSLHSSVSWPTVAGRNYIIALFGFSNQVPAVGTMEIALTSDGVQSGNVAACVSDRCPVNLTGIAQETDACNVSNNSDCAGSSVGQFVIGTPFGGTSYTTGTTRDFDFWHFNGTVADTTGNGTTWFLANYAVEFPGLMVFYSGACPGGGNNPPQLGAAVADYRAFNGQCGVRGIFVEATAGADFWINPTVNEFGGVPCAAGSNNYSITVTFLPIGSCCQPSVNCVINPQAICTATLGAVWTSGGTCTPSDPCSGTCCLANVCSITSFDGCAGGTFTAGGTSCTPSPCVTPGVCCRGSTCNTTITTAGACTASGTAGAFFATGGSTCNTGNVSSTPCCYADYNKTGGITVTDIFNFLSDWFASSPFARTGGDGNPAALSVQNIFDFLSNWFNGCS